ncbi:MAG: hypothetical protein J6R32_11250 [Bacteroidales bacterium]|nr:hypothetical protein [Bacteroidales bacterium]
MKIFKGYISIVCAETIKENGLNLIPGLQMNKYSFRNNGQWLCGGRKVSSYVLCDDNGDDIPEFEEVQFSKDRHNRFYIESIG